MKTMHLDPSTQDQVVLVTGEIKRLLDEGKRVVVSIAEEREMLSPRQAAGRLGFSRQHVVRLVNAGELRAQRLSGSSYWQIPLSSVLTFEEQRERARELSDAFSLDLDRLGGPLE
jgi:excisionase family DNA binding protein